jgi:hypothetical protein
MNTIPSALRAAFLFALIIVPLHGHAEESAAAVTDPILATAPSTLMDVFYNARTYLDEAQDIPSDAPKLGLAEVVQRAVEHSGTLKAAEELVIQREAQGEQARSARKPQVSTQLQLAYLGGLKQEIKTTPIADLIIDTKSFELGEALANGSIAVQQVIYAGGKIAAGIRATGPMRSDCSSRQRSLMWRWRRRVLITRACWRRRLCAWRERVPRILKATWPTRTRRLRWGR